MKNILLILTTFILSNHALADENCEAKLGLKGYGISAQAGGLAQADATKFMLTYWEGNEQKVVPDASFEILKIVPFFEYSKQNHNGMGTFWTNHIKDYAVRIRVKTVETELYPAMMGNPRPLKELTVSTMCTSNVSVPASSNTRR